MMVLKFNLFFFNLHLLIDFVLLLLYLLSFIVLHCVQRIENLLLKELYKITFIIIIVIVINLDVKRPCMG